MIDQQQIAEEELSEDEELYKQNILDHYKNPHNFGRLASPDVSHRELNPLCGDEIEIHALIKNNTCTEVKFIGKGCAISQASASLLTDKIKGMNVEEIKNLNRQDILNLLGIRVGIVRMKCALLALKTLQTGLQTWRLK